jgi:predicted Zn-dependent protease
LSRGSVRRLAFFASHPAVPTRRADAERRAGELTRAARPRIAADRAALLARLDGLVVGPDPGSGVVRGARLLHPDLGCSVRFPEGWSIANEPRLVVATDPADRAAIMLQTVGQGTDPMAAAVSFAEQNGIRFDDPPRETSIGSLRAVRAASVVRDRGRTTHLDLTWIAHRGAIHLLSGACDVGASSTFGPLFDETATSFRPLLATERNSIVAVRLRTVSARPDETVTTLTARARSIWSPEAVAIANALDPHARLAAGQAIKVAVQEPYRTTPAR